MRVVVDTNVFISAALKNSSWSGAVVRWINRHGGLLITSATEQEVLAVLQRPCFAPKFEFENCVEICGFWDGMGILHKRILQYLL